MRWKLLVMVAFAGALVALGLWASLAIGFFGSAAALARNNWFLLASLLVPLAVAAFAGLFTYRHTAKQRKTQAVITLLLTLLIASVMYLVAATIFVNRLYIPKTWEVRHAR